VAEEYEATKSPNGVQPDVLHRIIQDHAAIKNVLNEYEAMAIAIKTGALDEGMMRETIRQQFISHINACSEFIDYTRNKGGFKEPEKIWYEVQQLSKSWADK